MSGLDGVVMRVALVETASGLVSNVIEIELGPSVSWQCPAGWYTVESSTAGPGDRWDGSKFAKAPEAVPIVDPDIAAFAVATVDGKLRIIAKRLGLLPLLSV